MAKKNQKPNKQENQELDGVFLLKLAVYVILGSLWLKVSKGGTSALPDLSVPIPVGLIIGLLLTTHEHFRLDRKIEYAVLVVAALFGFVAPYGLYVTL